MDANGEGRPVVPALLFAVSRSATGAGEGWACAIEAQLAPHMIKLTETREITPYLWVHPDGEGAVRKICR